MATDCIAETGKIFPVSGGHICEGFVFRKVFKHGNIFTLLCSDSYRRPDKMTRQDLTSDRIDLFKVNFIFNLCKKKTKRTMVLSIKVIFYICNNFV